MRKESKQRDILYIIKDLLTIILASKDPANVSFFPANVLKVYQRKVDVSRAGDRRKLRLVEFN